MPKPCQCVALVWALSSLSSVNCFSIPQPQVVGKRPTATRLQALSEEQQKTIKAASLEEKSLELEGSIQEDDANNKSSESEEEAATGTINERLMAELQQAADKEKFGTSKSGKRMNLPARPRKTPEEQEAALAEARNLNGVNPVVALGGGLFAFAVAAGLWYATNELGNFFALHPVETDVYFVQRLASVFRNVAMGLVSLASGFFGVTGMGIFLLGVRVAVGVAKGELDPTPIKKSKQQQSEMPNVWDLMMNKKPSRSGGRGGNDSSDNPFGL
ncbi:expressed unknown protein [Seminavis robusta]|uniref:Transmembrane protein n=1 Tax=Seminavis robusta TaxID=568900 RepID=A0A9N8HUD8_9STRA|nr:expressed unknown protein [Seminavis robusta]|eukprot:Sro2053_g312660.2  (273) ;mRNA; r:5996-6814